MAATSIMDNDGMYLLRLIREDVRKNLQRQLEKDFLDDVRPKIAAAVEHAITAAEPQLRAYADKFGQELVLKFSIRDPMGGRDVSQAT